MENKFISIKGAREHNLKNIDIDIPRNQLVIITGVSGSGKSSLAFDTIYAEGQRRYVESLSTYARQFLSTMNKPAYDSIEGLSPSISIEQKTTSKNPRSTVGTVTEVYDYLRLLFARAGVPYSPATGLPIESFSVNKMIQKILSLEKGTRVLLIAPVVRNKKGEFKSEIAEFNKQGFSRLRIDNIVYDAPPYPQLNKQIKHNIDIIVDRIAIRENIQSRLSDSLETILKISNGLAVIELVNADKKEAVGNMATDNIQKQIKHRYIFSQHFSCPISGFTIAEIEPRLFSFNSPHGACQKCDGLGYSQNFSPELVIPNKNLSLEKAAIAPWGKKVDGYYAQTLQAVADHYDFSTKTPFCKLSEQQQNIILYGSGGKEKIEIKYRSAHHSRTIKTKFEGIIPNLNRRYRETTSGFMREELSKYQKLTKCENCDGARLNKEAMSVKILKKNIAEICAMTIEQALLWSGESKKNLTSNKLAIAAPILKEISERLTFLSKVGLQYLTLSRTSSTLSGGEGQRIKLASQIGSGLTGVLYVLDEPSIGLHMRDNNRLIETLKDLRNLGNSIIVVEHDEDTIMAADYVIDIGPYAGIYGGEITAKGKPLQILKNKNSLTGKYISQKLNIDIPTRRKVKATQQGITIHKACEHNLKNIDAFFPKEVLTVVTGVSGSGKSTLVLDILYNAAHKKIYKSSLQPGKHQKITGLEHFDKVIEINQSPIGRTPRSNPATYVGVFNHIRDWFSKLPDAKIRNYKPGRFSFNVKGGRCEHCHGDGVIKVEMNFLPDVFVVCEECTGKRFNEETLKITYKGKNISDVLNMSIDEGCQFFSQIPAIKNGLTVVQQVGLGYIKIGQNAVTLSGGEAQRIKLAKELAKKATGKTLYILDEATTGLHFYDIDNLLKVLHKLVDHGNTMIIIEHNMDVIKTCDWIIDIGPEGGEQGGQIIATGTPEQISNNKNSYTGVFLKKVLEKNQKIIQEKQSKKSIKK